MKAEELKLEELVSFEDGALNLHGRRLVLHSLHAFAQFRHDLVQTVGMNEARRMFTRFGYYWGNADAAAMKRIFQWRNTKEWIKAGPRMHALQGVTRVVTKSLKMDEASGKFEMEVIWHNSGEAEEHLMEFGRSDEPACWMLVGYASGYASFCMGTEIYFIERKCRAAGDRACIASGKDAASWGDEIRPHLPYFRADDIRGKVMDLTQVLKRQTPTENLLAMHASEEIASLGMVEVKSEAFRKVLELAIRVAGYDASVLITGESGVGKEVLARHIHGLSARSAGPFVGVNCGALPENLLESELFGHKRGSFTGATDDRVGLFEQAQKGTIFLDEIGDISQSMQLRLLRVLQEHEIMRVGESKTRKVDIRVIAATNRDLKNMVQNGTFREDLFYRLGVIEIEVPPLRDRTDDILPLARLFVKNVAGKLKMPKLQLDASCLDPLLSYSWPGNVRELENVIERAAILCADHVIKREDLPGSVVNMASRWRGGPTDKPQTLSDLEKNHIQAVLESVGGNKTAATKILGISPATLWRKLRRADAEKSG
ncbi:MAG: sigma 54-interacting transcriptional regulator [Lentisphaerae bacterium]|nr:sigma 54-interacting transcriptional regulator [Lentisphaerota bacterium]